MDPQLPDVPEFSDSRRLFGPSLWLDTPGVVLEGIASADATAVIASAWEHAVVRICAALGWPTPVVVAPEPVIEIAATDVVVVKTVKAQRRTKK